MADMFDVASRPVSGAYFVRSLAAGTFAASSLETPFDSFASDRLVWTHQGEQSTLKARLLEIIRRARRKIFIASFRIGDEELFEALFDAVDRLRGSVYVITLVDEKSLAKGHAEIEDDAGADKQALQKQFGPLVERGLYVRGHDSCHAKFVIVDDEIALISSANLESSAFTKTSEIGLVLQNKGEVARVAQLFARLWHECTWEVAPSVAYTVAKRAKTTPPFRVIPEPVHRQCAIWTHHTDHGILEASREAIKQAKRDLLLASFSLTDMAAQREILLSEIERFRKRTGGRVRLLVRARNHVFSQRRDAGEFAALGCTVVADDVNHAKCVIADGKEAVLFSANFDAQHGLTSGVEMGVRLVETRLVQRAYAFFDGLIRAAPMRLIVSPSHADLQKLTAGWITQWPAAQTLQVMASDADWKAFTDLGPGRPVLFERGTDGRLVLIVGRRRYFLQEGGPSHQARLESAGDAGVDSSALFEQWLLIKGPQTTVRGLCAGTFVRV